VVVGISAANFCVRGACAKSRQSFEKKKRERKRERFGEVGQSGNTETTEVRGARKTTPTRKRFI